MWNRTAKVVLAGIAALTVSSALRAQMGREPGAAPPATATAAALAPEHDLSGIWNMRAAPAQRKFLNYTFTLEPPEMTPWATEKYLAAKPSNGPRSHPLKETDDPILRSCLPAGVPRIYLQPVPLQIVHTPKAILIIYEHDHMVRQVFVDGRAHPADLTPTYMGHSIGRWDGDTLVVDTAGFNDKTWLDRDGRQHSDQLHVIERLQRADRDNMTIDITMEDPKALVKPWNVVLHFQLKPGWDILEQSCGDDASFEDFEK